jgi:hypothetical protein
VSNKIKFLAVIGVGDDRKPRAARFDMVDEVAARKATGLVNFRVGIPRTEQASTIVVKLPEGKLFESGAGLIPLCSETTFYKLGELLTFDPNWKATGASYTGQTA